MVNKVAATEKLKIYSKTCLMALGKVKKYNNT